MQESELPRCTSTSAVGVQCRLAAEHSGAHKDTAGGWWENENTTFSVRTPQTFSVRCGICNQVVEQPFEDWKAKKPLPPHEVLLGVMCIRDSDGRFPVFKTADRGVVMMTVKEMEEAHLRLSEWRGSAWEKLDALRDELLKALKKYGGK